MEFKFAPRAVQRAIGGGLRSNGGSATSHAVASTNAATTGPYGSVFDPARGGWDVDEAARRGLERVIWVFRCVDAIASNQARLPLVQRNGDPETGEIVENKSLKKLLNQRTNSYEVSNAFRYRLSGQLLLSKRGAFIEMEEDAFGDVVALHLLPSHLVEPIPDPDTFVKNYRVTIGDGSWREIDKSKVIWIKLKPHPIDPYLQMTPLMAAQLAVETDWLSRLFNANFLRKDGRPGMLIGVKGKMHPQDRNEIKDRFSGGPLRAGEVSVVEADDIVVQDLASSPRDVQWLEGIAGAKQDILMAFGVTETVLGNASGRTFDNADAEIEVFWSETMVPHVNAVARGLDQLTGSVDDDQFVSADYSGVAVLQRHKEARDAKLKEDYMNGVITLDEYLEGTGRKKLDVPGSRVYFHQSGIVIAANPDDSKEVAAMPVIGAVPSQPQQEGQPALPPGGSGRALPPVPANGFGISDSAQRGALKGALKGQRNFENIIAARAMELTRLNGQRALAMSGKSLGYEDDYEQKNEHPYGDYRNRTEGMFEGVLDAWSTNQADYIVDRFDFGQIRRGTRHWEGEGAGTKALDTDRIVDEERWIGDLTRSMKSMMSKVVFKTMKDTADEMDRTGVLKVMNAKGRGSSTGRTKAARVYGTTDNMESSVSGLLTPLESVVQDAAKAQLGRIKQKIAKLDAEGASLTEIKRQVALMANRNSSWRRQLSEYLTTALVEGAQYKTWSQAGDLVQKTWNTSEDERVRHSHREADGQTRPVGRKFRVGKSYMDHVGDPRAPIEEIAGCRCWNGYSISEKGANAYDELAA